MQNKHSFVSFLDLPEILPFTPKNNSDEYLSKLFKFFDALGRLFKEKIYYIGQDNIAEKFYERFLFEKGGFVEVMAQKPVAIVAHFVEESRAKKFALALKAEVLKIKTPTAKLVSDSIGVSTEKEEVLDYKTWSKLRQIREEV